ncbi:NAD(P)H-hydrate dehydratase [Gemmobacter aquatilis]
MTEVLSAAQMRAIERNAMSRGRVSGLVLMERAGAGVTAAILARWTGPEQGGRRRAVVLCGPGNNGGDGYVVARLLQDAGWAVAVHALAESSTPDARAMRALWGGAVLPLSALDWAGLEGTPVVVDALFGTGLARDIAPGIWGALDMAVASGCPIVAVDILTGLCADSGRVRAEGGYIERAADLTVTFEAPKLGHMLAEGGALSGDLVVVPIGLEGELAALMQAEGAAVVELTAGSAADFSKAGGHKFAHGHALVLAGGPGRGGAARLAARAALRVGAGLVTLGAPVAAQAEHAARLEAVMLRAVDGAEGLAALLADARINALCLGPGLGLDRAELVAAALASGARPVVLDADALTLIGRDPALFAALHGDCVLTPHGGEFERLFPDLAARLAAEPGEGVAVSKVDVVRAAAARAGCVVLLKGADTVIAAPDGRCEINAALRDRAAPWLATAGAGDVLAGIITGLLARGQRPFEAACRGAWLHVEAARAFGPGLIAEDLPERIPAVFRALGVT